jgi:thiamine kinase-like enzyme
MSSYVDYKNNCKDVLPYSVDLNLAEDLLHSSLVKVTSLMVPEWSEYLNHDVNVKILTGGITNILYLLTVKSIPNKKMIIRIYGAGTDLFINRDYENNLFTSLSKRSLGPIFFGLFENGRIEGYLNATPLEPEQFFENNISKRIASAVAIMHAQDIDTKNGILERTNVVWPYIDNFFDLANKVCFSDDRQTILNNIDLPKVFKFYNLRYKDLIKQKVIYVNNIDISSIDEIEKYQVAGERLAFDIALCHNDLLCGNIMLSNDVDPSTPPILDDNGITLIDFEYGGYNYRSFDIANHFCG